MNVWSLIQQGVFDSKFDQLAQKSWTLLEHPELRRLGIELLEDAKNTKNKMRPAQVGRGPFVQTMSEIRSDFIQWKDFSPESEIHKTLRELLRIFNESFFLGLESWECHFARYPVGARYDWHFDKMTRTGPVERVMTFVYYLNPEWSDSWGGELEIRNETPLLPYGGRMVLFRSDLLEHQVRICQHDRWSLTGWFLRRQSQV